MIAVPVVFVVAIGVVSLVLAALAGIGLLAWWRAEAELETLRQRAFEQALGRLAADIGLEDA